MRYRYDIEPVSEEQARENRLQDIENRLQDIEWLRDKRDYYRDKSNQCADDIVALMKAPLELTRKVQVELNPGDPGYDEAPECFSPAEFQGGFKWINIPTPPAPSTEDEEPYMHDIH